MGLKYLSIYVFKLHIHTKISALSVCVIGLFMYATVLMIGVSVCVRARG